MSQLNDVMFPVREVPIFKDVVTHNLGTHDKNGRSGYKFIVREDNSKILSCMSDDYRLITNETVLKYASPIIKKSGGKVKEIKSLGNGAKSIMTWNFPHEKVNIGKNDDLTPEIIIKKT